MTSKGLPFGFNAVFKPASSICVTFGRFAFGVAGKHGEELFAFVPSTVTIPTGTSLTFRMHPASFDIHTATTGPGNPEQDPNSYLGQVAAGFNSPKMVRNSVGATNPLNAAPGTIRGDLALDIGRNLIHASDALDTATRELALWFAEDELVSYGRDTDRWVFE